MVRETYKFVQLLLPTEPLLLTYEFSNWIKEPGDYTTLPVEIKQDGDIELFMSVRSDCVWLEIYVTFDERDVDLYIRQREEEDGINNEENQGSDSKLLPWKDKFYI